ncbi:MAG: hypothetical protein WB800_16615 [Streptosporangiaceae bacterium]
MTGDREERNRVLGFPVERHPNTRSASKPRQPGQAAQPQQPGQAAQPQPQHRPQDAEPQRVLGLPVDWLDGFADEMLRILRRIRGNRSLKQRK